MSKYTAEKSVWINEGGRVVCRNHGGDYLRSAIAHGDGPHILTPLDDWLYHSPEIVTLHNLTCEDCQRIEVHDG
ncbi:hypothetical protein [Brevibacterium sp. FME37]|uniref:hypothetical protein n=1 Tax=Brevibacterium sp. FME37 TaxID=2742607 RepID=UPI0018664A8C|nr:hypothetical protein [Brevibacterium sp. FME37]